MAVESIWSDDARVAVLREMWAMGKTASEIAKELGTTRNAVIGKAHRLELTGRPSPIKQRLVKTPPVQATPQKATGSATILALGDRSCKWPMGDPLSAEFHFCGKNAAGGLPYCEQHAQLAYQPKRSRNG